MTLDNRGQTGLGDAVRVCKRPPIVKGEIRIIATHYTSTFPSSSRSTGFTMW